MSNQKIVLEITGKVEITIVKNEKEEQFKTPERKHKDTIIVPDAPSKRRRVVRYPFDTTLTYSDLE